MKKYIVTEEEYQAVKEAQKKNIHKRQDKLLEAVALRYEGYTDWEIAYKLGWNRQSVSRMIKRFKEKGLEEYIQNHYKGNHRNLSEKEEKAALEKRLGRESRTGYVYDVIHRLIALQMDGSEALSIYVEQQRLNKLYDAYTAQYGLINSRNNASAFSADSSYYLLCSLEVLDNDGRLERKADMLTKRTIKPHTAVTSVDTAAEALAVSIAEKAKVDMAYMSQLSGKSEEELAAELKELKGVIN